MGSGANTSQHSDGLAGAHENAGLDQHAPLPQGQMTHLAGRRGTFAATSDVAWVSPGPEASRREAVPQHVRANLKPGSAPVC